MWPLDQKVYQEFPLQQPCTQAQSWNQTMYALQACHTSISTVSKTSIHYINRAAIQHTKQHTNGGRRKKVSDRNKFYNQIEVQSSLYLLGSLKRASHSFHFKFYLHIEIKIFLCQSLLFIITLGPFLLSFLDIFLSHMLWIMLQLSPTSGTATIKLNYYITELSW